MSIIVPSVDKAGSQVLAEGTGAPQVTQPGEQRRKAVASRTTHAAPGKRLAASPHVLVHKVLQAVLVVRPARDVRSYFLSGEQMPMEADICDLAEEGEGRIILAELHGDSSEIGSTHLREFRSVSMHDFVCPVADEERARGVVYRQAEVMPGVDVQGRRAKQHGRGVVDDHSETVIHD